MKEIMKPIFHPPLNAITFSILNAYKKQLQENAASDAA
jgi:hypothetical protein